MQHDLMIFQEWLALKRAVFLCVGSEESHLFFHESLKLSGGIGWSTFSLRKHILLANPVKTSTFTILLLLRVSLSLQHCSSFSILRTCQFHLGFTKLKPQGSCCFCHSLLCSLNSLTAMAAPASTRSFPRKSVLRHFRQMTECRLSFGFCVFTLRQRRRRFSSPRRT